VPLVRKPRCVRGFFLQDRSSAMLYGANVAGNRLRLEHVETPTLLDAAKKTM
jgi:hypothetical protein